MTIRCTAPAGARKTRFGEPPSYSEGLHDLGNDIHAWMVPNGSWGESNAGLVVGDGASLLIDTLWDPIYTREMLDAMERHTRNAPIETLVNTHADGDHFWGNQLLPDVDSITSARARAEMEHHKPGSMLALARLGRLLSLLPGGKPRNAGRYFRAMCAPYDFAAVEHMPAKRDFTGSLDLDTGGRLVRLIEVGPAHTQGDLIVHIPAEGILFTGDILFVGVTPVMWAGPLANWLRALDTIQRLNAKIIVPGHGPITDIGAVTKLRGYWEFVDDAARRHHGAGMSASRAAYTIAESPAFRGQPFAAWDSPERIMTNIHLLYREYSGKTAALSVPEKLSIMYRQAGLARYMESVAPDGSQRD